MTIGEKLKRERKRLNYDLDDVATETKISKMFLIALENDDISALPGGIYTRNFLRSYASFLDMDVDIVTSEFHEQYDIKSHYVEQHEQTKQDEQYFQSQRRKMTLIVLSVAAVLAILGYLIYLNQESVKSFVDQWITGAGQSNASMVEPQKPDPAPGTTGSQTAPVSSAQDTVANSDSEPEPVTQSSSDEQSTDVVENSPPGSNRDTDAVDGSQASDEPVETSEGETQSSVETPSTDDAPDTPDLPTESTSDAASQTLQEATPSNSQLATLGSMIPVEDPLSLTVVNAPPGTPSSGYKLEDIVVIEALQTVPVEVVIDGTIPTRRTLKRGDYRVYLMGNYNIVRAEDGRHLAVQLGSRIFPTLHSDGSGPAFIKFKKGELPLAQPELDLAGNDDSAVEE